MNLTRVKIYSLALASVFSLGIIGCNMARDGEGVNSVAPPVKELPAVNAPAVSYNFYEPASEEGLKKDTNYGYLIAKTRPGFKEAHFERLGLKVVGRLEANGASYYRLRKENGVLDAIKGLNKISSVMFVEPELMRNLYALEPNPISFGENADYYLQNRMQWGAFTTKAYDAWTTYGFGPHKAVVAAIDSGVQYNHEDLKAVVKHAYTWFNASGTSYFEPMPDDEYTWDPVDAKVDYPSGWGTDISVGHGTHTAGSICAAGNNGTGVAGMCWNVDLISYAGFGRSMSVQSSWTIMGSLHHLVRWKKENNYNYTIPVNFSLGGLNASRYDIDFIEYALQNDVMLIAASGNDYYRMQAYPAAYAGVMAVGASTGSDKRASFSNYGPYLSVVAPGEKIVSTIGLATSYDATDSPDKNKYVVWDGTSMAAPHVTGLAAYMLTFNPDLKPHEIKAYIERYADYIDGATGYTEEMGWGRINALNTINAVIDDKNAGRTIAPSYPAAPVKVKTSLSDLNIYLYSCNEAGTIQNYVASTISGYRFDEEGEESVAYFNMLRPGRYIAHAYVEGARLVASSAPFEVAVNQKEPLEVEMGFPRELMFIQTFPTMDILNSNYANACDTVVGLYDSEGNEIGLLDWDYWDTLTLLLPEEPGDYYIRITEFEGGDAPGEYGLWLNTGKGTGALWDDGVVYVYDRQNVAYPVAPGTYATPTGGVKGAQAQSQASAQPIDFRTIYYGRFNGDAADGGTNGETGHWYKFTFTPQQ